MAISPEQKKHGVVLAGSLIAIIALCWLMRVSFDLPTTTLKDALPAEQPTAAAPQYFEVADGAAFNGMGKMLIGGEGGEEIEIQRVTADNGAIVKGAQVLENPNRFKVLRRGMNGTEIRAHAAGATVSYTEGETFFFPENNASFGDDVDELFYLILWITGIAFILTEAFFLFCVICFWDKPGAKAEYTHGHHKFEMGATLVVVTILVLLALWQNEMWTQMKQVMPIAMTGTADFETQEAEADRITAAAIKRYPDDLEARADAIAKAPPIHVQVVGVRFKWYFRYPGLDGKFATPDDVVSGGMKVPAGRDVLLHFRSQDVIHSFFLPNYRVKQDVVPGMNIPGWFRPEHEGRFQIMCAELCGEGHTTMGTTLEVVSTDEYRQWIRTKSEEWAENNDGEMRRDWWGIEGKFWWWWDANPVKVGYARKYRK